MNYLLGLQYWKSEILNSAPISTTVLLCGLGQAVLSVHVCSRAGFFLSWLASLTFFFFSPDIASSNVFSLNTVSSNTPNILHVHTSTKDDGLDLCL